MPETEVGYSLQIQKCTSHSGGGGLHTVVDHNIQRYTSRTHDDETSAVLLHHYHSHNNSSGIGGGGGNNHTDASVSAERSFKGIRYRPELGRYISEIRPAQPRKRKIWLGTYKTAEEAARAFDAGIYYTKKSITYNFEDSPSVLEPLPANLSPEQEHVEIQKKAKAAAARAQPVGPTAHSPQSATSASYHQRHRSSSSSDHHHLHHHHQVRDVCGYDTPERIQHRDFPKEIKFAIVK